MNVGSIMSIHFVVEFILGHLDTKDLFTCAEVNRVWKSVALSLLRRKLISVSVTCAPDPDELHALPTVPSMHSCVDIFFTKFARCRNIARMAGMLPSLVFVSCHADLNEDKRVVDRLRQLLPPDAVVVYFKLDLVPGPEADNEKGVHEGVFGKLHFRTEELPHVIASYEDRDSSDGQQPPPDATLAAHGDAWRTCEFFQESFLRRRRILYFKRNHFFFDVYSLDEADIKSRFPLIPDCRALAGAPSLSHSSQSVCAGCAYITYYLISTHCGRMHFVRPSTTRV